MSEFQFTDEQFVGIREIWRDIQSQCKLLQKQTGCPNSDIVKMIDSARSYWENHKFSIKIDNLVSGRHIQSDSFQQKIWLLFS